jgi:hypothetical protein
MWADYTIHAPREARTLELPSRRPEHIGAVFCPARKAKPNVYTPVPCLHGSEFQENRFD